MVVTSVVASFLSRYKGKIITCYLLLRNYVFCSVGIHGIKIYKFLSLNQSLHT
ncbi:MAG: hypothetical protein ACI9Z4_000343 [Polaribacter sp.]|jgi:hypothetical protein